MDRKLRLYGNRPNKLSAGMQKTRDRQNPRPRPVSRDTERRNDRPKHYPYANEHDAMVGRLLVRGTTDEIGRGWIHKANTRGGSPCSCCGQTVKKYRLTDWGKKYLMKKKREKGLKNEAL
jgi:hypothetical protein